MAPDDVLKLGTADQAHTLAEPGPEAFFPYQAVSVIGQDEEQEHQDAQ